MCVIQRYTGFEKELTPQDMRDYDHDIAFDGNYIYEAAQGGKWCQIRKFDKEFNILKKTPILKSDPNEFNLDLNVAVINDKIFLGTEYRENGDWCIKRKYNKTV